MCGKETGAIKKINIESSILSVCQSCAKFGKEEEPEPIPKQPSGQRRSGTSRPRSESSSVEERLAHRQRRLQSKDIFAVASQRELVEDYHKVIQQARMAQGLNQEELARKLNERKSIIAKLETKSLSPDNKLIKKLEKALKIELMENVE
jgi:putative transcription factor